MTRGKLAILGWIVFLAASFLPGPAEEAEAAGHYPYEIRSYQIDMEVTKQNVYKISETLQVYFNESRHGIYRNIPLVNQVEREDKSRSETRAGIRSVHCGGDDFELSREGDDCRIKIGDEDKLITGGKIYKITYEYNLGNDVLPDIDEFYYNIVGTGWKDTTISNLTFSITMPEAVDPEKIGMVYGKYGQKKTEGLQYKLDGNTLYGELEPFVTLDPEEALTVRIELPEGYYEKNNAVSLWLYLAIAAALAGMATAFFLWWKFGRDDPVVETVEFHAPDGLNSVDLAFAYKGKLDDNDVISLLVYLAQKGYLSIQQGTEKNPKKNTFTLIKRRDYDGNNAAEKLFFDNLFSGRDQVTKKDLQNSFYKTIGTIIRMVDNRANRQVIFVRESLNKGWILYLLTFAAYLSAAWKPSYDYNLDFFTGTVLMAVPSLAFIVTFSLMFRPGNSLVTNVVTGVIGIALGIVLYLLFLQDALVYVDPLYQYVYFFVVLSSAVTLFFNAFLSRRTPYGTEILGRIRGFKHFLETAEKDRLEAMVTEDPQYFYEILPYTYVLGISDKWMKKFESIAVEPPVWYSSYNYNTFDYMMFHHFMRDTMHTASTSMTSSPHSSSGGGGGFSGGGSGGGGGGSW